MKLTFLGTRASVAERNRRHRRHAAALVAYRGTRVMIDAGEDWRGRLEKIAPDAIVVTHGHPDHAFGLADGAPCPVFATAPTWQAIDDYPVEERHTIRYDAPFEIAGIAFVFVPVEHSTRAPAGGYRIVAGEATVFYVPDVVSIHGPKRTLRGVDLYVGDGSTIERSLVRRVGGRLVGHTPIRTQLGWCAEHGVARAAFTHCGSEIVAGDERTLRPKVRRLGKERGVEAAIARDGMQVVLP
jgi:phosphoribosyl 1,2-cyclic phosphodiesterase